MVTSRSMTARELCIQEAEEGGGLANNPKLGFFRSNSPVALSCYAGVKHITAPPGHLPSCRLIECEPALKNGFKIASSYFKAIYLQSFYDQTPVICRTNYDLAERDF